MGILLICLLGIFSLGLQRSKNPTPMKYFNILLSKYLLLIIFIDMEICFLKNEISISYIYKKILVKHF